MKPCCRSFVTSCGMRQTVLPASGLVPGFSIPLARHTRADRNSGVFLQITCDDPRDIDVPGHRYSFGIVKAAQARADLAVLGERRRRAIRVHVSGDIQTGLERLTTIVRQALEGSA